MVNSLREIIFDTETTGLDAKGGDRIIEIGAIELVNRFPTGKTFHVFINPEDRQVHPEALEVHGISNDFLKEKPLFSKVVDEFEQFFSEGMLVAHNATFDIGFINSELERVSRPPVSKDRVIDTLMIARRKFPGQRNSLDALCSRFGIDNSHREKHGALLDSELLAEVYIELLGGKQASLVLDHSEEIARSENFQQNNGTVKQRPNPLPSRLTAEDIENHKAFVETLGENSVWKKTGVY